MIGDAITFQKQLPPCGSLDIARFSARSDTRNWHRAVSKIFGGKKALRDVRFTPKSGHWNSAVKCPLCAKSGHSAPQQNRALRGSPRQRAACGARKGSLDFGHPHLGFNRVGNETILMGGLMHLSELFRTGLSVIAPRNLWA